ncbi:MAG TPA: hypothetical protein VLI55_12445 [Bryobacteraceae bacterium]|nr:hypothetical protein [Bryobacteraceae bacterium]
MQRLASTLGTSRQSAPQPCGLLATATARRLADRARRHGTPGLIAPGPGFTIPQLRPEHCEFSPRASSHYAAQFAQNLLRAGVAQPSDWFATRSIGNFLERTLKRFVGERAEIIDRAFSLYLSLSPTVDRYDSHDEESQPERVLLSFQVIDTVAWVNLMPALDLLAKEHELLPSFFYHSLYEAMSRWFRVYDLQDARMRWDDWVEMRAEEEEYRKAECERAGVPYEPAVLPEEPAFPSCVQSTMPDVPRPAISLARRKRAKQLIDAVESLAEISRRPHPPLVTLSDEDREELYVEADPDVPMLALAFGNHDIVTEFLNEEIETAGQVALEPWPTIKMDGTQIDSIRDAFACADIALDTLAAAARVLLLVPGYEPLR